MSFLIHMYGLIQVGIKPGDVVIILDEQQHETFVRRGANLVMQLKLTLVEALCGCTKFVKTLDNRYLIFSILPGEVIKHGDMRTILGEGMPHYKNPFEKGDLIVQFDVTFPKSIAANKMDQLKKLLPDRVDPIIPDGADEVDLEVISERSRHSSSYYDEQQGGGPVRCQTQ
ncbi:unnamed protein product [Anisakis simplex]|uniref:DnaJ_C domain-containing protein n=1 Tax=Anisakis simplex TaxID=6269 RepID=A0A0M3J613_ANISI|nr:unnamed protein product [Anisakis simplex]